MSRKLNWDISHILTAGRFGVFIKELKKDLVRTKKINGKLRSGISAAEFKSIISYTEDIKRRVNILSYFGLLMEAVDQKSQQARLFKSKAGDMEVYAAKKLRKIEHWIKGKAAEGIKRLDDKNASRLFKAAPDLTYVLKYKRKLARHTLSEQEEDIIANKDAAGQNAVTDLRALIETEFEYFFKPEGSKRGKTIKTRAGLTAYLKSSSTAERKEAYETLLEKYRDNLDKFFIIYQAVVKDWGYEARLRNFKSPISVRNKYNRVSDKAVDTVIKVCEDNRGVFHRFFKYKAAKLGKKKLSRYDLYAPLAGKAEPDIPLKEAKDTVLQSIGDFSGDFRKKAEEIINANHIDYMPSPVKTGGAFCATVEPGITPYIMLNYSGRYRDILTLAHELGHGIHSLYASKHSLSAQQAPLPLAETASTLAETLVFEKLYRKAGSKKEKRILLGEKMGDLYATVLRQNYFVKFELEAHKKIREGITSSTLSDIYYKNLKDEFGHAVSVPNIFKYEWAYIPHIVNSPFYCYAYNFGELLAFSLYSKYKTDPGKYLPKIIKILRDGGSVSPRKVLNSVGIDMESEKFWETGFKIIESWQKEIEEI